MRKWRLPLTYQPKIEPVLLGTCRQTIRPCTVSKSKKHPGKIIRKEVGDLIRFFVWSGKPYRSKQIDLTDYEPLVTVINCRVRIDSLQRFWPTGTWQAASAGPHECRKPWNQYDCLAARDGIVPPTGEALRDVLTQYNKIPPEGIECQILRW